MSQFAVHRNSTPDSAVWAPYLLTLQSDLLEDLATVVVAPLVLEERFGRPAQGLNPVFHVEGHRVVLSVAELAGISRAHLGVEIQSLAEERDAIIGALDLLFTGI
ncbi:CcdB family protein [Thiohalorhabdus methylotrophus]|uniref:Toxin CcdB n=1 Tax=Thiohalorhabdus methylotrophus TaxID=3242694 RepID=A0ABV4U145_9GAMM